jgi:outer membrane protein TolC
MKTKRARTIAARLIFTVLVVFAAVAEAQTNSYTRAIPDTNSYPGWLTQPLSLTDAVNLGLQQNATILKSKQDLEAAYGVAVQTRAIALPHLNLAGQYEWNNAIDTFQFGPGQPPIAFEKEQNWNAGITLVQSIFESGRITSALRSAKLTREQAILQHQAVVSDTVLAIRTSYYDTQLAGQQIKVRAESVELLQRELQDTTRRYEAGTVPKFNVLRSGVEVANAKPQLSRAQNAWRISKNNLANLLGYNLPANVWEDIPLQLTDGLSVVPMKIELSAALSQALERRPELGALRKAEGLAKESVINARAGTLPSVQVFGGYSGRNSAFEDGLSFDVHGWNAGVQLNWSLFDGLQTQGRVTQAKANQERARVDVEDAGRRVELEVRTAYSSFIEAQEVLEATQEVVEEAVEALRLANARYDAGTGTQLDVLNAETSLTDARTTKNVAVRNYLVAVATLEHAMGQSVTVPPPTPAGKK